jgi:hypothetical protein
MMSRFSWLVATFLVAPAFAGPIEDLQPGQWAAVSLNTLSDVDPCPASNCSYSGIEGQSAVLDDWNGGAFATRFGTLGGYIVWGGGHAGYYGNELYVFDVATLRWVRHTQPVVNGSCDHSIDAFQNGSPCARHTYDYVDYHPPTNSFVSLGGASVHECGGCGTGYVHAFSFNDNTWRRGTSNFAGLVSLTGASSAYDPRRAVHWVLPAYGQRFSKYDLAANSGNGAWTQYSAVTMNIDTVSAIDPIKDLFVSVDSRSDSPTANRVVVHDLAAPSQPFVQITTSGDRTIEFAKAPGFEWDPVAEKFVGWASGTSVYTLTPPASNWKTSPWTWQKVNAASTNTVTPTSPNANGTYSRWRYMPSVNAFIVVNRVNEPVFVYKLSPGGSLDAPAAPNNLTAQ